MGECDAVDDSKVAASIVAHRFEKLLVNWLRWLGLSNVQVGLDAQGGQGDVVLRLQLWHKVCQSLSKIFRCVVTRKADHCNLSFHVFVRHDMRVHDGPLVEGEVDEVAVVEVIIVEAVVVVVEIVVVLGVEVEVVVEPPPQGTPQVSTLGRPPGPLGM